MGFQIQQIYVPVSIGTDVTTLKNNELKVTYYAVVSGTSGTITPPGQATFNSDEFGASGNAVLSEVDGSNKPTFETPQTGGGTPVTVSLNTTTGAWTTSGVYTSGTVALIYSLKIKTIYYPNLTYNNIIGAEPSGAGGGGATYVGTANRITVTGSIIDIDPAYDALKEDAANKSNSQLDTASTTKFPVWAAVVSYVTGLGYQTVSGLNAAVSSLGYLLASTAASTYQTLASFASDVRGVVLTGLSLATNAAITASDSILSALGKLQKQITDLTSTVSSNTSAITTNTNAITALTSEATISALDIDWSGAPQRYKTLSANSTFTFSNTANGKQITILITNTAGNYTVTWPTVDWGGAGAPVQRTGANTDVYSFIKSNGVIYGTVRQ